MQILSTLSMHYAIFADVYCKKNASRVVIQDFYIILQPQRFASLIIEGGD